MRLKINGQKINGQKINETSHADDNVIIAETDERM